MPGPPPVHTTKRLAANFGAGVEVVPGRKCAAGALQGVRDELTGDEVEGLIDGIGPEKQIQIIA